jgi:hypothetical protein
MGELQARQLLEQDLIDGAVLQLCGELRIVGARPLDNVRPQLRAAAA